MADYLENIDWNLILVGNIDYCWENWKNCFLQIMDMSIPNSTVITNRRFPWINHTIIQAMRKCKVLFDIYKCTKKKTDQAKYQAQRNRVVTLLQESKELGLLLQTPQCKHKRNLESYQKTECQAIHYSNPHRWCVSSQ